MNQKNDQTDELDNLLGNWADRREPSADHLDRLHARIVSRLDDAAAPAIESEPEPATTLRWLPRRRHTAFAAAAAAAIVVIASVVWFSGDRASKAPIVVQPSRELPEDYAWLRDDQLRNKQQLLADMKAIFADQLQWVAETGDRVELGLAKNAIETSRNEPLAVRVVVEQRANSSSAWEIVWAADLVAHSQQPIEFRPSGGRAGTTLSMWAYRLPDGMVFVESDLRLSGAHAVHCSSESLLTDKIPATVAELRSDGSEFRMLQTVTTLGQKTG